MSGWIKVQRDITSHPIWTGEEFSRGQAWIDLLLRANWKPGYVRIRGHRIELSRGQLAGSSVHLAERWGWSRGKVTRFLDELQNDQQIEQQKTNVTTVITISNYDRHQQTEQQTEQQTDTKRAANRTADGQQTDTTKKEITIKEGKDGKEQKKVSTHTATFEAFWDTYPKRNGKRVGKAATSKLFSRLGDQDQQSAIVAAGHYAASQQARDGFAKDPERFIKNDFWRDWVEPAEPQVVTMSGRDNGQNGKRDFFAGIRQFAEEGN